MDAIGDEKKSHAFIAAKCDMLKTMTTAVVTNVSNWACQAEQKFYGEIKNFLTSLQPY